MDRSRIERRDFPVGRRGYDPGAVDAHLRGVADELERVASRPAPLAAGASEQVRLILEAAEASAAQLQAGADRRAGAHVARVQAATAGLLARVDALEHELTTLLATLRAGGEQLTAGLARLHEEVAHGAAPGDDERLAAGDDPRVAVGDDAPGAADPGEPPVAEEDYAAAGPAPAADEAGARLTALDMALAGRPREEAAAYLAEHYAPVDAGALLDEIYARAGR